MLEIEPNYSNDQGMYINDNEDVNEHPKMQENPREDLNEQAPQAVKAV